MSTASGWFCLACASRRLLETVERDAAPADAIGSGDRRAASIDGLEVPARLGPFEVIEEIGRGGMGAVYAARHTELGHVVALKVVAGGCFATAEQQMRFVREAQTAARLRHPNIVAVHDAGRAAGVAYYAMDLIADGDLARRAREQPLRPTAIAVMVQKIALAVEHAHREGVLHRDLKPSNILLEGDEPRVADFGLATELDPGGRLTVATRVLGTPAYIAPEVFVGGSRMASPASDIYALGAILYELLTSRPPFFGADGHASALIIDRDPVAPRLLAPAVPLDLETICLKCLEKEPERRYSTAATLAEDLGRWTRGEPILARPAGVAIRVHKWVRRRPAIASLAAGLAVVFASGLAGVFWQWSHTEAARRELARNLYAAELKNAFHSWEGENFDDALAVLEKYRALPNWKGTAEDLRGFEWRHLWWVTHRAQMTIPSHRGPISEIAVSNDGKLLAIAGSDTPGSIQSPQSVAVWQTDPLHAPREIARRPDPVAWWTASMAFVGGGTTLAISNNYNQVMAWDFVANTETISLPEATANSWPVHWSPDQKWIVTVSRAKVPSSLEDRTLRLWDAHSGELRASISDLSFSSPWMLDHKIRFSNDGTLLGVACRPKVLRVFNVPDLSQRAIIPLPEEGGTLAFSPDWRLVAVGYGDNHGTARDAIDVWDLRTGTWSASLNAAPAAANADLCFSPDSRLLAGSFRPSRVALWDVESKRERAVYHSALARALAFSSDGSYLMSGTDDGSVKLWNTKPSAPSALEAIRSPKAMQVLFTGDGQTVAVSTADARVSLFDKGTEQLIATLDPGIARDETAYDWTSGRVLPLASSRDGKWLVSGNGDGRASVWDLRSRRLARTIAGHEMPVFGLAFAAHSAILATFGWDKVCKLWNAETGELLDAFSLERRGATIRFDPQGEVLAIGDESGQIFLWDRKKRQIIRTWKAHRSVVIALDFSPDGRTLASGCPSDDDVKLWPWRSGGAAEQLAGRGQLRSLAFSPDGKTLATSDGDGTTKLWHLPSRQVAGYLRSPAQSTGGAFSPDGNTYATCSFAGGVRLFHATPAAESIAPSAHD